MTENFHGKVVTHCVKKSSVLYYTEILHSVHKICRRTLSRDNISIQFQSKYFAGFKVFNAARV